MSEEETWQAVDVSGPTNTAYQIWSRSRMVAIAFSKADADAIIHDHQQACLAGRQAQQVAALVDEALEALNHIDVDSESPWGLWKWKAIEALAAISGKETT